MDLYFYSWIFVIYALIGWIAEEVVFALLWSPSKIVNRGFLNGPYCPIYGFGALAIVLFLTPLKDNFLVIFFVSAILASLLELITGALLELWFRNKWWDYSRDRFNFKGYICLKSFVMWGACSLLLMYVLQPIISTFVVHLPKGIGLALIITAISIILIDLIVTLLMLRGVARKYKFLGDIDKQLTEYSDFMSKGIFEQTREAVKFKNESIDNIEKLKKEYKEANEKRILGYERIMKAFPDLKKSLKIKK